MERLALSHPDVSFKFISNGQTKMHTSGNSNEKDLIYHIYGRDITAALLPVCAETEYFSVKGFVGKPMISRGNRSYESYFINGRYIKSALLSKAVEEAYKGLYDAASVSVLRAVFYHGYGAFGRQCAPDQDGASFFQQ